MPDITFKCRSCSKSLTIDATGAGMEVDCPNCNASVKVPETAVESRPDVEPHGTSTATPVHQKIRFKARPPETVTPSIPPGGRSDDTSVATWSRPSDGETDEDTSVRDGVRGAFVSVVTVGVALYCAGRFFLRDGAALGPLFLAGPTLAGALGGWIGYSYGIGRVVVMNAVLFGAVMMYGQQVGKVALGPEKLATATPTVRQHASATPQQIRDAPALEPQSEVASNNQNEASNEEVQTQIDSLQTKYLNSDAFMSGRAPNSAVAQIWLQKVASQGFEPAKFALRRHFVRLSDVLQNERYPPGSPGEKPLKNVQFFYYPSYVGTPGWTDWRPDVTYWPATSSRVVEKWKDHMDQWMPPEQAQAILQQVLQEFETYQKAKGLIKYGPGPDYHYSSSKGEFQYNGNAAVSGDLTLLTVVSPSAVLTATALDGGGIWMTAKQAAEKKADDLKVAKATVNNTATTRSASPIQQEDLIQYDGQMMTKSDANALYQKKLAAYQQQQQDARRQQAQVPSVDPWRNAEFGLIGKYSTAEAAVNEKRRLEYQARATTDAYAESVAQSGNGSLLVGPMIRYTVVPKADGYYLYRSRGYPDR